MDAIGSVLSRLFSLHQFGIKLGLDNIVAFLSVLGNPQQGLKAFHIAGSNGKGSTASFTASILQEAHYKTGLYTSPHFVRFNERISINGEYISDEYICAFYARHEGYILQHKLTFFEVTTALAFQYFKDHKVDFAVIETGLGGRLDATNVLSPLSVAITSISLEHTNILGGTVEQIAAEKAAIIKKGAKVFLGKIEEPALAVITDYAAGAGAEVFLLDDFIIEREGGAELYTEELDINRFETPLPGYYQRYNASLAILSVYETLGITDPHIYTRGVKNVIKNTRLQGRYEIVSDNPRVILDSAHNPDGMAKFIGEFRKEAPAYKERILLFSALKDKNIPSMLIQAKPYFDAILVCEVDNERKVSAEELLRIAGSLGITATAVPDPGVFLAGFIRQARPGSCLVVAGSMYLLGMAKEALVGG